MKLEQRTWTGFVPILNLIMALATNRDQIGQLVGVEVIAVKFAIWLNVMYRIIVFLFSALFSTRLALKSIAFSCAFSLRPPVRPACICIFAVSIPMTIFAGIQYTLSCILAFFRAIMTFVIPVFRNGVFFSTHFASFSHCIDQGIGFCTALMRTKLTMLVLPRFKLLAACFAYADFSLSLKSVITFLGAKFTAIRGIVLDGFPAIEAFGIMRHSNECPFVAHSWGADNTSRNLFALNYSTNGGM